MITLTIILLTVGFFFLYYSEGDTTKLISKNNSLTDYYIHNNSRQKEWKEYLTITQLERLNGQDYTSKWYDREKGGTNV